MMPDWIRTRNRSLGEARTVNNDDRTPTPGEDPPTKPGVRFWLLIPLVLALTAVILFQSLLHTHSGPAHRAIGKPAPQIDLVALSDDLTLPALGRIPQGQVTLLHFWGTWCGPCKLEYPHLSQMTDRFVEQPQFRFVPVTCEYGGDETFEGLWEKTRDYFRSAEVESIAFADPRGVTRRSLAERLENDSLYYPTSVLIDHDGNIAGVWEGYTPEAVDQIASVTDQLIADCRVANPADR